MIRRAAITGLFAVLLPAGGKAATFSFRDFLVPGASSVTVSAINDLGVAVGVYGAAATPPKTAFIGQRGRTTDIANYPVGPAIPGVPAPAGITNDGTVIGTVYTGFTSVFTWKNGAYTGTFGGGTAFLGTNYVPPTLATGNQVSYNVYHGHGIYTNFAGLLGQEQQLNIGGFATVTSTNRRGEIAGQYQTFIGNRATGAVFFGSRKKVVALMPAGGAASSGGWLNDVGQVAGSYRDTAGGLHGFVYYHKAYTSFDVPGVATALSVQGIDLSGRVVGAYQDTAGQHGFYYSHGVVTRLGTLRASDTVQMSVSHFGRAIAMSVTAADGTARSYVVRCVAGAGAC